METIFKEYLYVSHIQASLQENNTTNNTTTASKTDKEELMRMISLDLSAKITKQRAVILRAVIAFNEV